ncbi:MAG: sulfotransferase domain-containing protein [Actinomycetia bacterium]|nr:sulfotransferase domain-containing protein [Actinomycetes bacterium]
MLIGRRDTGQRRSIPGPLRRALKSSRLAAARADAGRRPLPDFLVIGGQRCGTTSLFRYIAQHPGVVRPSLDKGIHYFDTNYTNGVGWYRAHFPRSKGSRLAFEASPYYLFHPLIPARIASLIPDAKLITVLRDPVARAISHHNHERERGFEDLDLLDAIEAEPGRMAGEIEKMVTDPGYVSYAHQHYSYVGRGRYADQLERYQALFPADRLLVLDSDELSREPATAMGRVTDFLGLDPLTGGTYDKWNGYRYDKGDDEVRARLAEAFADSDARLPTLLGWTPEWMASS